MRARENGLPCTCKLNLSGLYIRDVCVKWTQKKNLPSGDIAVGVTEASSRVSHLSACSLRRSLRAKASNSCGNLCRFGLVSVGTNVSLHWRICVSVSLLFLFFAYLFVYLFICLFIYLFVYLFIYLFVYLFICLFCHLFVMICL